MAMVGLVPLTGIPLPLISYGGSALVTLMAGIGLLLNASCYTDRTLTPAKDRGMINPRLRRLK
jgi:cell division protein FtsW (lipid II flippase)